MWGQNVSEVIREDEGPRYYQYKPHPVPLGKWKVTKVRTHVALAFTCNTPPPHWEKAH